MVEVFPAIFPASIDVAPYSPIALAKASVTPDMIPGFAIGRRILQKIFHSLMPRVRAAYMTFSSICSNAALAFLYMRGSAMMVAATTQPSHVCTTCIPMLWLKKLPKGRLVLKILKRMYPATVGGSTIGSVSSPSQNALTLPFVFMTSSAKAIPIKKEKTDATIPVFNVTQSGEKSICPIIPLPKNDIFQILTLPHLSEGMR